MKVIDLNEIPEPKGRGSDLRGEVLEFLATKGAKAAVLREYNNANTARSTASRLNDWSDEEGLPFEAVSRGGTVYLRRVKV